MKKLLQLLPLLLLASCTVMQHHYRPGYTVEWNKAVKPITPKDSFPIIASTELRCITPIQVYRDTTKDTVKCDEITMTNGDIIKGKVQEIGVEEIKYKDCDNMTGPTIDVRKSTVFEIRYYNGKRKVINTVTEQRQTYYQPQNNIPTSKPEPKTNGNAIAGMILGILSITAIYLNVPIGIVGLILSLTAKKQISLNGEKGIKMAKAGVICSIIGIVFGVIFLLAQFALI